MRKNIDISDTAVKVLDEMALLENRATKNFIETQIEILCKHKVAYLDLWNENKALKSKLEQLS